MIDAAPDGTIPLLGRSAEQQLLSSLLGDVPRRGQALVLDGEPGIGKSRLVGEAERMARELDFAVLSTSGVQSEADLPFAGLHQLLRPVRDRATSLRPAQRNALDAAFGLTDAAAPEPFRIALAALDLLSDVAAEAPLLLVLEDVHWLDRPSADALAFVARRIESDPILLLAAIRDGHGSPLLEAGLPRHSVAALGDEAAASLIDASVPGLPRASRSRVLREAAGNPLAILELPTGLDGGEDDVALGGAVPLTGRLERAFADRVSPLPDATRVLLLVAASDDGDGLHGLLAAATKVAGTPIDVDAVEPARAAGLVDADLRSMRIRHPLIRSAIVQGASLDERRRVHEALAAALADQPDRRAWHRAALLVGTHEDVAAELDAMADRALRRSALSVAVSALKRAAELGDASRRTRRLLRAATLAVELGRPEVVVPLLQTARTQDLDALDQARLTWIEEAAVTGPLAPERFEAFVAAAEQAGAQGDRAFQVDLLGLLARRAWWVDPGPRMRSALVEAAHRLGDETADDPRVLAVHAYADPVGHAAGVLRRLTSATATEALDAEAARFLGPAALVVGAFDLGEDLLEVAVEGLRTDGRLMHLPRLLALQACMGARMGNWEGALTAADEARRLADEFAQPEWGATADTAISLVAAMRGDEQTAESHAAHAEMVAEASGANITMAFAQFGRVLAALAGGRYEAAYADANRLFDPADPAHHPVVASWMIADLATAAVHIGAGDAARDRLARVAREAGEHPGTWVALSLLHARALLADEDEARALFDEALRSDLRRWPFQRARLQLAYGQWLRRDRHTTESRALLRSARDTFDALGCEPWSEQARRELRASGERSRRRVPEARDQLTAQELQIAQLAAEGLSNREIGQRLFLSHRTVSTHLYRAFPKLGVSSRGELHAALVPALVPEQT